MVLESELKTMLKQERIKTLYAALEAAPTITTNAGYQYEMGFEAKEKAIQELLDAELDDSPDIVIKKPIDTRSHNNFSIRNLSVLAYANGFTLWHYKANAMLDQFVTASGYFAEAHDMLVQGDMIMCSAPDGAKMVYVTSTSDVTVDVMPIV